MIFLFFLFSRRISDADEAANIQPCCCARTTCCTFKWDGTGDKATKGNGRACKFFAVCFALMFTSLAIVMSLAPGRVCSLQVLSDTKTGCEFGRTQGSHSLNTVYMLHGRKTYVK